ncbi:MAG: GNAT family N-acetyltransferase, partial [Acidimicrobiales bacterium]
MDLDIRPVAEDEFAAFAATDHAAFGDVPPDDALARHRAAIDLGRTLAAFDGRRVAGTAYAFPFELTLPGRSTVPAGGVSWVGVLPTHRRQGVLTALMRRQLADLRAWGEPVAILIASESIIYGRFGYGLATTHTTYEIDRRHTALA